MDGAPQPPIGLSNLGRQLCDNFEWHGTVTSGGVSKNALDTTVIFTSGFWSNKFFKTGTVIATSPIDEKRITKIC